MPKAILEFSLPEEKNEFDVASRAQDWILVVWKIDQMLRSWLKYGHDFKKADDALEEMRKFLYETLEARNLTMEDM